MGGWESRGQQISRNPIVIALKIIISPAKKIKNKNKIQGPSVPDTIPASLN